MKSSARWMLVFIAMGIACLKLPVCTGFANDGEVAEATAMMSSHEAQQRAAATQREKDAAWRPACREVAVVQVGERGQQGTLKNFCLDAEGNILACLRQSGSAGPCIQVYSPKGELLNTMPLEIEPGAICLGKEGAIFVAGAGRVLKLDRSGKVMASAESPVARQAVTISKEMEEMAKEMAQQNKRPLEQVMAEMKSNLERRRADVTGLATTGDDVFMAVPAPNDFSFRIYRFNLALQEPKLVVERLRGCCGQMDVQAHEGKIWIPHNARHKVESLDRDGNALLKFGTAGRVKAADFGGCCEPKNMRVLPDGEILAAESGPPTCIKRFTADGKFKEVVALVTDGKGDCVRVTVEASPDGRRFYLLDTTRDAIRVFEPKMQLSRLGGESVK